VSERPEPEALLAFWFGADLESPAAVGERMRFWFGGEPGVDRELRARFVDWPDRAARGELDAWAAAPRSALARVITLDQLPRNLFRGSARAFAYDALALEAAEAAVAAGFDGALHPIEAGFLYLPFEHAERLEAQQRSVALLEALEARGAPALRSVFAEWADYARRHRAVIERFGRFPHRNAVLGRLPTAAERAWLAAGGESFGGGAAMESDLRQRREDVVRRHMEAENVHDFETVMRTFAHPRYEIIPTGQVHDGDAAVRQYFRDTRSAFPDQRNEPISLRHADDAVVVEFWLLGTHRGALGGIEPTGRSFRVRMTALFLFDGEGDRIVCERVYFDAATMMRQLTSA
jgi:steroid delta-isomerase-like uncharacterized protein